MENQNDRFIIIHKNRLEGLTKEANIVLDKITGVQYLLSTTPNGMGLTVLVDQNGKPLLYQPQEEK